MKRQPTLDPETVLEFWFGDKLDDPAEVKQRFKRWFTVDPDFDSEIRDRFGSAVAAAARGELHRLTVSPRGALAVILLLDQFPRNIFRGQPDAFAFDDRALACCRDGITRGLDASLSTVERSFFYLPLEHAEDLTVQRISVAQFHELVTSATGEFAGFARTNLDYAEEHLALIERFGRFPHRNGVLGRTSSADEGAFLAADGKRFGQG